MSKNWPIKTRAPIEPHTDATAALPVQKNIAFELHAGMYIAATVCAQTNRQ